MWQDILRKDFVVKKPWYMRLLEWAGKKTKLIPEGLEILGGYAPITGNVKIFLSSLQNVNEQYLTDAITEILTHEYVHKALSETPGIKEELSVLGIMKPSTVEARASSQEWAAYRVQGNLLNGLIFLSKHPAANANVKQKAKELVIEMNNKMQNNKNQIESLFEEWGVPKTFRTEKYVQYVNEWAEGKSPSWGPLLKRRSYKSDAELIKKAILVTLDEIGDRTKIRFFTMKGLMEATETTYWELLGEKKGLRNIKGSIKNLAWRVLLDNNFIRKKYQRHSRRRGAFGQNIGFGNLFWVFPDWEGFP